MRWTARLAVLACLGAGGVALAQAPGGQDGRIGAALGLTGNGRHLQPFGRLTTLGNFPTGAALTPDGRFYWTVSTGRGPADVRIVEVATGRVVQTLPLPGASGGIAIDPVHPLAYVSGVTGSHWKLEAVPPGTPGADGDVIHVFRYDAAGGHATFARVIAVPPPAAAPIPQNFPPFNTTKIAWPDRLAISPDGARLLVPLNLGDAAAVVDVAHDTVRYVNTGHFPYGAAILPGGRVGLVSNETPGTVSVIDLVRASKIGDIQVGAHLSHPEAIALDASGARAFVALANSDQVAVIDLRALRLERTLAVGRPEGLGTSPVALTVSGERLIVAESGADELSVFRLRDEGPTRPAFSRVGAIPTGQYPADVAVAARGACQTATKRARRRRHVRGRHQRRRRVRTPAAKPSCAKLLYISAKGLGTGPNADGPIPTSPNDNDEVINRYAYLPLINIGSAAIADLPSDAQIEQLTPAADAQALPTNPEQAPADTPLRAGGPIKHVFYIVRENRTYDQVLGDLPRGDGDPKLTLFGAGLTPNVHALVERFPLLDHFYANSEASIDGHVWASAGAVSDYVHKQWFQNYRSGGASHGRPYDFGVYAVTWPGSGFLFDQAERQGISYLNYGEGAAGVLPLPDKDRTLQETQFVTTKFLKSDGGPDFGGCYPNVTEVGKDLLTGLAVFDSSLPAGAPVGAQSRVDCFRLRLTTQLATNAVPTFNYLVLPNDHTRVLEPGARTPISMVADNDYGLGQMIETISHSPIWKSSAIFVTEDDSQDGPDHVDAHRTVGLVISPYAKPAAVVHTRYDMLSMIRSMELIMGMRPLGLGDAVATPMYDAFQSTPANAAPFSASGPRVDLLAKNPPAASPAEAARLRFRGLDRTSQLELDRQLWRAVHGAGSVPPPPGPNAVAEASGRD